MCEYSGKLIAWLDGELPQREAADVARHLRSCGSCKDELGKYERLSDALDAYCEMTLTCRSSHEAPRTRRVLLVAAAAAALAAMLFVSRPVRDRRFPGGLARQPSAPAAVPMPDIPAAERPPALQSAHLAIRKAQSARPATRPAEPEKNQDSGWMMAEPAIQITIPADAVLPPGAAPTGANFVADVRIAGDGSALGVMVRP